MISKKTIKEHSTLLSSIKEFFDMANFQSEFYPASPATPVPILSVLLRQNTGEDAIVLNMAFTPLEIDEIKQSKILQFSISINPPITEENRIHLIRFANQANTAVTIGHYTVTEQEIWYRYSYSLSQKEETDFYSLLEIISLFSLLHFEYEPIFMLLAHGKITFEEAMEKAFPFL